MEYREKYLKYKNKYLKLKNQRGGNRELFELIRNNSPETDEKAIKIINTLSNLNVKDDRGISLLTLALYRKKLSILSLLIEKGADINIIDDFIIYNDNIDDFDIYKRTPLMMFLDLIKYDAYESKEYQLVKYLIEKGANINYENGKKETALLICIRNKLYNILELLFSKNVEIKPDVYENCPLHELMINARLEKYNISELLFSKNVEIKPVEKSVDIELLAIKFIKKGALVKENNMENKIIFRIAIHFELPKILTFLIDENYDSELDGITYHEILVFAEKNQIESLINAVKKKINIGEININYNNNKIKIRVNNKVKVKELRNLLNILHIDKDSINFLTKFKGQTIEMDDERLLNDYGLGNVYKEMNIDIIPKMKTGLK